MLRALFLLVACVLAAPASAQSYQIQPGDTLDISVLEDPGLNRSALVRPDGRISLPLAGSIDVADRTPEQVEAAIRQRLSRDFVTPPTVTVALTGVAEAAEEAAAGAAIYIIGAVANPGRFPIVPPLDVLQALALSGGPGPFAAADRIQIRRRVADAETVMFFDYEGLEDGTVPTQAIALQDGDVIVVPERGLFE